MFPFIYVFFNLFQKDFWVFLVKPSTSFVKFMKVKVKVTQSRPTLCDPMDYTYMDFSRPEYWSGQPFPSPGDLPNPGIKPRSPTLQADSLPVEPQGEPLDSWSVRKILHRKGEESVGWRRGRQLFLLHSGSWLLLWRGLEGNELFIWLCVYNRNICQSLVVFQEPGSTCEPFLEITFVHLCYQ